MTAPSPPHLAGLPAGRRMLRRLSRDYAGVGVVVSAGRLRQIASGCPASETELVDIAFADAAIRFHDERRQGRRVRVRRRCVRAIVVTGAVLLALGTLICFALTFFMLAAHTSPF